MNTMDDVSTFISNDISIATTSIFFITGNHILVVYFNDCIYVHVVIRGLDDIL